MAIQSFWPFNQQKACEAGAVLLQQRQPTVWFAIKRIIVKVHDGEPRIRGGVSTCKNMLHVPQAVPQRTGVEQRILACWIPLSMRARRDSDRHIHKARLIEHHQGIPATTRLSCNDDMPIPTATQLRQVIPQPV